MCPGRGTKSENTCFFMRATGIWERGLIKKKKEKKKKKKHVLESLLVQLQQSQFLLWRPVNKVKDTAEA